MRSLAAFFDRARPDIFAVSEIDAGDALALATRFALQWGYRGAQSVFWRSDLRAVAMRDNYLPFSPSRPFDRRGIIELTLQFANSPCTVLATQIGADRDQRIREMRHLRTVARGAAHACLVFAVLPSGRIDLTDLGFKRAGCRGVADEALYVRGFDIAQAQDDKHAHRGIGTPLVAKLSLTPSA